EARPLSIKEMAALGVGIIVVAGSFVLMARGGNYKVVRQNLQEQGKLNAKLPLPTGQKRIRRAKRKKK
ncbi:MAG TPA: hypothetical protein VJI73_01695, partial [Candidatus Paceibacterota bacterium]